MRAAALKPLIGRIIGATLGKRMTGVDAKPGLSLILLPDAALPEQFRWAGPDPAVAGAIARMASAIERHGSTCLPEAAMETVRARVAAWAEKTLGSDCNGWSKPWRRSPEKRIAPRHGWPFWRRLPRTGWTMPPSHRSASTSPKTGNSLPRRHGEVSKRSSAYRSGSQGRPPNLPGTTEQQSNLEQTDDP